jgi:hypothetical protein
MSTFQTTEKYNHHRMESWSVFHLPCGLSTSIACFKLGKCTSLIPAFITLLCDHAVIPLESRIMNCRLLELNVTTKEIFTSKTMAL